MSYCMTFTGSCGLLLRNTDRTPARGTLVESVSTGTVGLACVAGGGTFSAPHVLLLGDRLEVRRVDAGACATQMIELECGVNVTNEVKIGKAMYGDTCAVVGCSAVAVGIDGSTPDPAAGVVIYADTGQESEWKLSKIFDGHSARVSR